MTADRSPAVYRMLVHERGESRACACLGRGQHQ
jgi:hypothetical protein